MVTKYVFCPFPYLEVFVFILRAYSEIEMYKLFAICLVVCTIHTTMCIESNVDVTGGEELEIDHRQKPETSVNEKNEKYHAQSEDREGEEEGTYQYIIKTNLVDFYLCTL